MIALQGRQLLRLALHRTNSARTSLRSTRTDTFVVTLPNRHLQDQDAASGGAGRPRRPSRPSLYLRPGLAGCPGYPAHSRPCDCLAYRDACACSIEHRDPKPLGLPRATLTEHPAAKPSCLASTVGESRHRQSSSSWTRGNWLALAGVIVGIATLVVTYLAYEIAREVRDDASPSAASAPTLPATADTYATTDPEPAIRHRNRIELRPEETSTANLDAPQSSADWAFDDGSPPELRFTNEVRLIVDSGEIVSIGRRAANYSTCVDATGYERRSYDEASLIVGDYFCVRTSEGRVATFQLIGARPDLFTVDAVVYEPQSAR
jgi:hypothetical protein